MATRLRETKRVGLSAAKLKITKKWRTRLYRERRSLKQTAIYRDNGTRSREWFEIELLNIENRIRAGRDAELNGLSCCGSETGTEGIQYEERQRGCDVGVVRKQRALRPDVDILW